MTRYDGKAVLITGAARGIGLSTGRRLTELGARVFIADLDGAGAEAAAAGLPGTGSMGFGCDVSKDSDVQALREAILAACPAGIDMLINNAAKPPVTGAILTTCIDQWRDALDVNVLGYVRMIQAFLPEMVARGSGHIVNTSSALALLPDPPIRFMGPYIASKGAQLSMSYAFAHALAGSGVTVSVFCPGITATSEKPGGVMPPMPAGLPGPEEFAIGVPQRRTVRASAEHASGVLVDGLARGDFLICSQDAYGPDLVDFASANYDPRSIVRQAEAEIA